MPVRVCFKMICSRIHSPCIFEEKKYEESVLALKLNNSFAVPNLWHECRELGIGIVPYSPLGRGFFGGKGIKESLPQDSVLVNG